MKFIAILSVFLSVSAACARLTDEGDYEQPDSLEWHSCEDIEEELSSSGPIPLPIKCASLSVPLDYTNPESEELELSLVKVDAIKEPVRGSVLFNPGGPGGSGVEYVATASEELHEVLGGNYNLIGFDPRGTGKTIPFNCNHSASVPLSGNLKARALASRNLTEAFLKGGWDETKSRANSCFETMNATGSYLSTPFVVRDMVRIIDALGEDGMLRYWGTSYGTFLGSTFAAMFPERVDRMLLDGVVNPHHYADGTFMSSLDATDDALLSFLSQCVDFSGQCPLAKYAGPEATPEILLKLLNAGLHGLLGRADGARVYTDFKTNIFRSLYAPEQWPALAQTITDLLTGNYDPSKLEPAPHPPYNEGVDSLDGIKCTDTNWRANSPEEILDVIAQMEKTSSFADVFFRLVWTCPPWRMKAKEIYTGNFSATTNFPILLVGSPWDPVTPLVGAVNASAGFENSVVLTHNGFGHGLIGHPSLCTVEAVREYFIDGTLPKPSTVCEPNVPVFELSLNSTATKRNLHSKGDLKLLDAMSKLHKLQFRHWWF